MLQMVTIKKHVGDHCIYEIISIYFCAFVGTTVVCIQLMHGLRITKILMFLTHCQNVQAISQQHICVT